jgi:integrase
MNPIEDWVITRRIWEQDVNEEPIRGTSKKRANNTGSVFQVAEHRWAAQVTDPTTRKQHRRYAKTRKDAWRLVREMLERLEAEDPAVDSNAPFQRHAEDWLEKTAGQTRSPNTVYEYRSRLARHVFPRLGNKPLGKIRTRDIEAVLADAIAKGLSRETVLGIRKAMGAVFSDAVRDKFLKHNPVTRAKMRGLPPKRKAKAPTSEEVRALYQAIPKAAGEAATELGRVLLILMLTGARIGEVLAMRWDHVDLVDGTWELQDTLSRDQQGRTAFASQTKTGDGRIVVLLPEVVQVLELQQEYVSYRKAMAPVWQELDLVFPSTIGTAKDERNLRRLLKEAYPDWPHVFHGLRHWFISVGLLDSGVSKEQVSKMAGHKSSRTTDELYSHLMKESSDRVYGSITRTLRGEELT